MPRSPLLLESRPAAYDLIKPDALSAGVTHLRVLLREARVAGNVWAGQRFAISVQGANRRGTLGLRHRRK